MDASTDRRGETRDACADRSIDRARDRLDRSTVRGRDGRARARVTRSSVVGRRSSCDRSVSHRFHIGFKSIGRSVSHRFQIGFTSVSHWFQIVRAVDGFHTGVVFIQRGRDATREQRQERASSRRRTGPAIEYGAVWWIRVRTRGTVRKARGWTRTGRASRLVSEPRASTKSDDGTGRRLV